MRSELAGRRRGALRPWLSSGKGEGACVLAARSLAALGFRVLVFCAAVMAADGVASETNSDRHAKISKMTATEKEQLRRKQERFARLPLQEQERLRQLERTLAADPDGSELREVMQRYHTWLAALPSSQRTELLSLPVDQRVAKIKGMLAEQEESRRIQALSSGDHDAILAWVREQAAQIESKLLEELPERDREEIKRIDHPQFRHLRLVFATIRHRGLENDPARYEKVLEIKAGDRDELVKRLSGAAQETYRRLESDEDRRKLVQNWILRAMFRSLSRQAPGRWRSPPDLRRFLDVEAPNIRDQLDYLPPERIRAESDRIRAELERFDSWRRDDKGGRPPGWPGGRFPDERRPPFDEGRKPVPRDGATSFPPR